MKVVGLLPGESFFNDLARHLFDEVNPEAVAGGDLSHLQVLVPALPMAAELRAALARGAPKPLLLPRFDTLRLWAQSVGTPAESLPESRRLVLLHEALRSRKWFDDTALWGIATEMAALFDELSAASVQLPEDEAVLAAQLENAYALRASRLLAFEARVVHELWRALTASGAPDAAAVYRLQLAALAQRAERPLVVLLDAVPDESLDTAERDFLRRYAEVQPVLVVHPLPREVATTPLLATLAAAWSGSPEVPLFERAAVLAQGCPLSPLTGRVALVPTSGRELEAQAAVAQVCEWLQAGLRRVALIAQDRLTARRVRALLERESVLVSDETGWLLSTSRAAAMIDALLEMVAGNAYHRDLLDLCKSPFVFSDMAEAERKSAVSVLEVAIRGASVKAGLPRVRRALLAAVADNEQPALTMLDGFDAANALLDARPAPLARWISRLRKALEILGALPALAEDVAGQALLELLKQRAEELDGSDATFAFGEWRDWLGREFEASSFRDAGIASPIVVTPLNAVCLRRFEAALLIGGDARQLSPVAGNEFFNQAVRQELGLRTHADRERELRRDLELLLATVPRVTVTWQSEQNGEANLLAPEFLLLSTLHELAWGDALKRSPLLSPDEVACDPLTEPSPTRRAMPSVPPGRIPKQISVSGYGSLVACPYRFFARHVLRLGEMDEVSEDLEKSDYGELVHRVLERFHVAHPLVSALSEEEALHALQRCVEEAFAPAIAENFLATGWRLRWEKRLVAYLDWQREREMAGWRWARAETKLSCALPLADGGRIELYGRIDRIDTRRNGGSGDTALLDYKTQTAKAIRERLGEDVQLPAYALMHGDAAEAAYVALDDEDLVAVASGTPDAPLMALARAQGRRLVAAIDAMQAGASLPAHGADSVCRYCEMDGVCRTALVV